MAKVHTTTGRAVQWVTFVLLLAGIVGLSACGKGNATGTVTAVSITPTSGSVSVNQQLQFQANVTVAGSTSSNTTATNTTVTWLVNGTPGGSPQLGSIQGESNDSQIGIYTAPQNPPGVNNNTVQITATAQRNPNGSASGGADSVVTSNIASVQITTSVGLQIVNPPTTVVAGGSTQFNATFNGVNDINATWAVSSTNGGNIGSITTVGGAGLYAAPNFPPPGDIVTISVTDSSTGTSVTKSTTIQITYSYATFSGSYAFSYTGNDSLGFLAAAGSFTVDGKGDITGGIEDIASYNRNILQAVQILGTGSAHPSTYIVTADGRGVATLNTNFGTQTIAFTLTTNQHALITRFDSSATGSGSIDQQNLNELGQTSAISGQYVFNLQGIDSAFSPESIAGEFFASGGAISQSGSSIDIHDGAGSGGTVSAAGTLGGGSTLTVANGNSGRGTLSLIIGGQTLQFAFYVVDKSELYLVEIDELPASHLAGVMLQSGPANLGLPSGNYSFVAGGMAPLTTSGTTTVGPFAIGGIFGSSGSGAVSSGLFDLNNQGTLTSNGSLVGTCGYSVNPSSGRIDLHLCTSASPSVTYEFALYPFQTESPDQAGSGYIVAEVDANNLSTGIAYQQLPPVTLAAGGFAIQLAGQGLSHGGPSASNQNVDGHFSGTSGSSGTLDVNYFAATAGDPLSTNGLSLSAAGATGRGTLALSAQSPRVSYSLVYYVVSPNEALLINMNPSMNPSGSLVMTGILEQQF